MRTVREQDAAPEIRAIYGEIRSALGLPHVNAVFEAYGAYPTFLKLQWERFRPVVETKQFFALASRLRADAYTRVHNYFEVPDLCAEMQSLSFSAGAKNELSDVIELFDYNDSLLLLFATAQQFAFEGPVGDAASPREPAQHPVFETRPILVEESGASAEIIRIYDQVKHALHMPVVMSDMRALARWPDFLRSYWNILQQLLENAVYRRCQFALAESAWSLTRELPGPIELTTSQLIEAGMSEEDIGSLVRMTNAFERAYSGAVLNIALAKIGLEGGNRTMPQKPEPHPIRAA